MAKTNIVIAHMMRCTSSTLFSYWSKNCVHCLTLFTSAEILLYASSQAVRNRMLKQLNEKAFCSAIRSSSSQAPPLLYEEAVENLTVSLPCATTAAGFSHKHLWKVHCTLRPQNNAHGLTCCNLAKT